MKTLSQQLNEKDNFHLSLKCIEFSDQTIISEFQEKLIEQKISYTIIDKNEDIFQQLWNAYQQQVEFVLYSSPLTVLLPLVLVITNENITQIKPIIPVFYYLKDNKIIQQVKTLCNKTYTQYQAFKSHQELFDAIFIQIIKKL